MGIWRRAKELPSRWESGVEFKNKSAGGKVGARNRTSGQVGKSGRDEVFISSKFKNKSFSTSESDMIGHKPRQ